MSEEGNETIETFIPRDMRNQRRWMARKKVPGTDNKQPYSILKKKPSEYVPGENEKPGSWRYRWNQQCLMASYDDVRAFVADPNNKCEGISFIPHHFGDKEVKERIVYVDFDDAFGPDGKLYSEIEAKLEEAKSFVEYSRSKTGVHLWFKTVCAPFTDMTTHQLPGGGAIEIHCTIQCAVTGNPLEGHKRELATLPFSFVETLPNFKERPSETVKCDADFAALWEACPEPLSKEHETIADEMRNWTPAIRAKDDPCNSEKIIHAAALHLARCGYIGWTAYQLLELTPVDTPWSESKLRYEVQRAYAKCVTDGTFNTKSPKSDDGSEFGVLAIVTTDDGFDVISETEDQASNIVVVEKNLDPDPGPLPSHLISCPGFIDAVKNSIMETAQYPCPHASFVAATHLQSVCFARKITDPDGTPLNRMTVTLAPSGHGKNHPRKYLAKAIDLSGRFMCLGSRFSSQQGIEDRLSKHPVVVYQSDEVQSLLKHLSNGKESWDRGLMDFLLEVLTQGGEGGFIYLRDKANLKIYGQKICMPWVSFHATSTPGVFYLAISVEMEEGGFTGRCIHYEVNPRQGHNKTKAKFYIPTSIVQFTRWAVDSVKPDCNGDILPSSEPDRSHWASEKFAPPDNDIQFPSLVPEPEPVVWPRTDDGQFAYLLMRSEIDSRYTAAQATGDDAGCSIWARVSEQANMFALDRALSRLYFVYQDDPHCFETNVISEDDVNWGYAKALHLASQKIWRIRNKTPHTKFANMQQTVIRFLKKHGRSSRFAILHNTGLNAKEFDEVMEVLLEGQYVKGFKKETKSEKRERVYITKFYELTERGKSL